MKIFAGLAILLTLSTSVLAEGLSSVSFLPCYKSEGTSSFVTGLTENPDLSFVADRGVAIVSYNSAQGKQELRNTLQKVPDVSSKGSCFDTYQAEFHPQGQKISATYTVSKSGGGCHEKHDPNQENDLLIITSQDLNELGKIIAEAKTVFKHQSLSGYAFPNDFLIMVDQAWGTHFSNPPNYICKDGRR